MRITIDRARGAVLAAVGENVARVGYGAEWRPIKPGELTARQERAIREMAGAGGRALLRNSRSGYVAFVAKRARDYGADFYTVAPDARRTSYTGRVNAAGEYLPLFRGEV